MPIVNAHDDQEIRADQHVQEGVRRVIEKIPFIKPSTDIDLNYGSMQNVVGCPNVVNS